MKICRIIFSIVLIFGLGCASVPLITPENAMKSRIEINYTLGHSQYKYVAVGDKNVAQVSSYRDNHVLETKTISTSRYQDFAARLESAIRSSPAGVIDETCRTPYIIKIIIDDRESSTQGCRSADPEGQIGQLLKEGEFLFYTDEAQEIDSGTEVDSDAKSASEQR